eukprot:TRINITY_DN15831_c0_g1_i1.p1 TRINITY_DN15831_c0_g1~~TRINITY_DN15831_c0_g1_i1.p1  ORF type:complete len:108 (+),score=7.56 TRINITY_DN15831_c0_g1_i1:35-358(+)
MLRSLTRTNFLNKRFSTTQKTILCNKHTQIKKTSSATKDLGQTEQLPSIKLSSSQTAQSKGRSFEGSSLLSNPSVQLKGKFNRFKNAGYMSLELIMAMWLAMLLDDR